MAKFCNQYRRTRVRLAIDMEIPHHPTVRKKDRTTEDLHGPICERIEWATEKNKRGASYVTPLPSQCISYVNWGEELKYG